MNHKDVCFLGLLALAYVYLDSRPALLDRARVGDEAGLALASGTGATMVVVRGRYPMIEPGCPRVGAHPVSRRRDGAIWCRGCDEAFYPAMAEWDAVLAQA